MPIDNPLEVVASAITPVVLVSATAILIGGINARYMAIADRIRSLTAEYRASGTSPARLASIGRQLPIFQLRVRLVSWAIRALYVASGCFVGMALLISATLWRKMLAIATLPLFLSGIMLLIFAIVCELLELKAANRTLLTEVADLEQK